MNREAALKWIEALRSQKFDQTIGALGRGEERRCCLGVAHECLLGPIPKLALSTFDTSETVVAADCYTKVRAALHLTSKEESEFIHMNDIDKKSFDEIAGEVQKRITPQLEYKPHVF
jgi:hypothetical protein